MNTRIATPSHTQEWRRKYKQKVWLRYNESVARAQADLRESLLFADNATVYDDDTAVWPWHVRSAHDA